MGQACLILALGLGLAIGVAGCGHAGPEDPAIAVPGEGIPMGAAGARGVPFDQPPLTRPTGGGKGKAPPPAADPDDAPPDPFAAPPAPPPHGTPKPPAPHHPKPSGGMPILKRATSPSPPAPSR